MAKSVENKSTNFLKLIEERALLKKEQEEAKKKQQLNAIPYLSKDCISNILVRLPVEFLPSTRFVCKPWYKIVNSPIFIDAHLHRAETVLIFLSSAHGDHYFPKTIPQEKPNTFSVEAKIFQLQSVHVFQQPQLDPRSKLYIRFMKIKDGKSKIEDLNVTCLGKIRATCNGLVLLDNAMKRGGLVVMNPVTRELDALPLGTISHSHHESYGLTFSKDTKEYKVVHLLRDEMQFVGCEILNLGARSWRVVNGPSVGLFSWFGYEPVFAIGAVHWIPHIDDSDYLVSMTMDEEKFHKILLPKSSRSNDRIFEVSGVLCFVTHEEMNQIHVWILMNLSAEDWTRQYIITEGCIRDMVPLYYSTSDGELILMDKDESVYAYDFQLQVMRKVEMGNESLPFRGCCLPHVNSLVSWRVEKDLDSADY